MILAILFDFGGTLDGDGLHWLDRFYAIYDLIGLSDIPKSRIKEAFYWADEQAERDPDMLGSGLRAMMERHVAWQFEKLGIKDPEKQGEAAAAFIGPAEDALERNRDILEKLHQAGLKIGILSNFYGNVEILCHEFGLIPYLDVILDSAEVGLRKPDPKLFELALNQLGVAAEEAAFVGDSYERDIVPAKSVGMKTYWLVGKEEKMPPDPRQVDGILHHLGELLDEFSSAPRDSP
jgi:putative hydrolase of the HAD superfamily